MDIITGKICEIIALNYNLVQIMVCQHNLIFKILPKNVRFLK
jgi:hypothetical protein